MRRLAAALAVTAILVMATTIPASANSWFSLRINPSTWNWTQTPAVWFDLPYNGSTNMFGVTGFWQFPGRNFGIRGNWDSGSLTSWGCPSLGGPPNCFYDGGSWRWYDISFGVQRNMGPLQTLWFVGYGNTDWRATLGGTLSTQQVTSGLVLGADFWFPLGNSGLWYATGNVTWGPSQHWRYCNPTGTTCGDDTSARAAGSTSVSLYSIGVGRNLSPMSSVELGWRGGGFGSTSVSTGDTSAEGQNVRWSGYYLALTIRK